ncbi:MAG TPA: hypothetical protein VFL85_05220 [Candidatus Saccharimonadales bacterium]|nr:hypothetical protein [Candidatus Saccharimonadales bacterium]
MTQHESPREEFGNRLLEWSTACHEAAVDHRAGYNPHGKEQADFASLAEGAGKMLQWMGRKVLPGPETSEDR